MKNAYAYINGSIEDNFPAIEQYCHSKKYSIRKRFVVTTEAPYSHRKQLWNAIRSARPGSSIVVSRSSQIAPDQYVFWCVERILKARNVTLEWAQWDLPWMNIKEDTKVAVDCIFFLASNSERSRPYWGAEIDKEKSRRIGRYAPYGWELNPDNPKQWIKNEVEQGFIGKMHDMHGLTVRKMVKYLNSLTPRGCRGAVWRDLTVRRIMNREGITGIKPAY